MTKLNLLRCIDIRIDNYRKITLLADMSTNMGGGTLLTYDKVFCWGICKKFL